MKMSATALVWTIVAAILGGAFPLTSAKAGVINYQTVLNFTAKDATDLEVSLTAPTVGNQYASFNFTSVTAFVPNFQDVRFFNGTVKAGATDRIGWVSVFPSTILSGNWSIADPTDPGNRNKSTNIGGFGAGEPNVVGDRETAFRTNPDGSVTVTLAAGAAEAYTNLVIYNGAKGANYTVPLALDDLNTGNQVATSIASSGVLPTSSIDLATFFPQNGYFGASISIDGLQSGFAAEVPEPPGWALLGIASGLSALGGLLRRVRSLQERFHAAL